MNFSKTTSYSLNILCHMAEKENKVYSATLLHKMLDIPYPYLRSILGKLSKKHLVKTVRGRNGGFMLSRPGSEISIAEVIETTESFESLDRCLLGFERCPFNHGCFFHPVWTGMRNKIINILSTTTLSDTIRFNKGQNVKNN